MSLRLAIGFGITALAVAALIADGIVTLRAVREMAANQIGI